MKNTKKIIVLILLAVALCLTLALASACNRLPAEPADDPSGDEPQTELPGNPDDGGDPDDPVDEPAIHNIAVEWSDGVEGVVFMQGEDRLLPKNNVISTSSQQDITLSVDLLPGYRQNAARIFADGVQVSSCSVAATVDSIQIEAVPNASIEYTLGEGVGYKLVELGRQQDVVGFTGLIGVYLQQGYRENSAPNVRIAVEGADYRAVSSLASWGLDEVQLRNEGYHSFYEVYVRENTAIGVMGVVADSDSEEDYVTINHTPGVGYTLIMLVDSNSDGISDYERVFAGSVRLLKNTQVNLYLRRDSDYSTRGAKLWINAVELKGVQGDGADESDPLSNELIYVFTAERDTTISVTGVVRVGQFVLHIMNSDGTQRYRTFCRADSLAEALAQVPGNDARDDENYSAWWEANPGDNYTFEYWHFVEHEFVAVDESYIPSMYEDVYCGYVENGSVPTDPGDRPIVPPQPPVPVVPSTEDLPQSLKDALAAVGALTDSELESKQWVLAWAAYQLQRAGVTGITRPAAFGYDNIRELWLDDVIRDAVGVTVNDLWVYAFDMLRDGRSDIDVTALATDYLLKDNGGVYTSRAANKEVFFAELLSLLPAFDNKTSFAIGDTDMELNMCMVLICDELGIEWSVGYGNAVKDFTVDSLRAYTQEHAAEQVMSNVIKEVLDFVHSIAV